MSTPINAANQIVIKAQAQAQYTLVKILVRHPMETGQRKDDDQKIVPINYIRRLWCEINGKVIFNADWSVSTAKDPMLTFRTTLLKKGDTFKVFWQNDRQDDSKNIQNASAIVI